MALKALPSPSHLPPGTVTLWSPSVPEPLVRVLCHRGAVRALAIDASGT